MDFHALSRRELQALCKRNRVRANMTNADMAEALQSLPSVDGIDEIRRTAPPVMSAMNSAPEVIGEEQPHGCPLPRRGRARAKTRRAAAHKTEEAAPAPATLQGSQRMATPEAAAPMEAEGVSTAKRRTRRRSARSKGKMAVAARKEPKPDSSDTTIGSAVLVSDKSCDDPKEEQVVAAVEDKATTTQEGIVEEQKLVSTVHKSASLSTMEDLPILSVSSKVEAPEPVIEMEQHASVGDAEAFAEWSPAREMTDKINPVIEDKAVVADEMAVKEDGFTLTDEADQSNLLVNTLDRFVKPVCEFAVKEEKKEGECWWMLM
ncbi:uncharacterized protein LOC133901701 [Phragmites australis]|uniref:uncharacterized protein LOC133901701 n=1 Tax=Phragmites australis TaxID=29695 RepID=UPI002D779536|nr:uncharacterized protein LOC133901701 [Phragmites australis]